MDASHPANPTELPATRSLDVGLEAGERRARHLRILAELAEIGMELVQHVQRQVLDEDVPPGADPVLAFARLAKAVRQTVALEAKVALGGFSAAPPIARGAAKPEGAFRSWNGKSKAKVRQFVEAAITSGAEPGDAEDLLRDLDERLDDPEYGDEMADRPIGMIVALICGAMEVKVDLRDFTDTELGFDREDVKAAVRAYKQAALDVAAVSGGNDTKLPVGPPKVGTGLDPP